MSEAESLHDAASSVFTGWRVLLNGLANIEKSIQAYCSSLPIMSSTMPPKVASSSSTSLCMPRRVTTTVSIVGMA